MLSSVNFILEAELYAGIITLIISLTPKNFYGDYTRAKKNKALFPKSGNRPSFFEGGKTINDF